MRNKIKDKVINWNGNKLRIRLMQKKDEKIFIDFLENLSEKSKNSFQPHAFDLDTVKKIIDELYIDIDIMRFLTIEENSGKVIAYNFFWSLRNEYPSFGIGISDNYQGKGLGEILINHFIEVAKSLGKKGINLSLFKYNERAYKLYLKMGFKVIEAYSMILEFK